MLLFMLFAAACGYFEIVGKKKGGPGGTASASSSSAAFQAFKNNYLLVYSLMMAGDWLQGPYVYALYQSYGYDRGTSESSSLRGSGAPWSSERSREPSWTGTAEGLGP